MEKHSVGLIVVAKKALEPARGWRITGSADSFSTASLTQIADPMFPFTIIHLAD